MYKIPARGHQDIHPPLPKKGLTAKQGGGAGVSILPEIKKQKTSQRASNTENIRKGEGKWGRKKCRRIPEREGDWQGRVPKRSLHPKTLQNKRDLELPIF